MLSSFIIDSRLASLEEAMRGIEIPPDTYRPLVLIDVSYISFDGLMHAGQLVVHRELRDDVRNIFASLLRKRFPVKSVIPVCAFGWSDDESMAANNSSAFNYRFIAGTERLSEHARGRALDLNPMQNPYIRDATRQPAGATYDPAVPGTITQGIAALFQDKGWVWGATWTSLKDYQHFEKPLRD